MLIIIFNIFAITYILSVAICYIDKKQMIKICEDEIGIIDLEIAFIILAFLPIINLMVAFLTIKDFLITNYLIYKVKNILRKLDKEGKLDLTDEERKNLDL